MEGAGVAAVVATALERARDLGFLGPGPIEPHLVHAQAMADCVPSEASDVVDLGSGGGLPGLVIAAARPGARVTLVDAGQRRWEHLQLAADELMQADPRIEVRVVHARAEALARQAEHRESHACVVARSFGSPAVVAECGSPLLRLGGVLIVSEPPVEDPSRWPADHLDVLGLADLGCTTAPVRLRVLEKIAPSPDTVPRRVGLPAKRPLWD